MTEHVSISRMERFCLSGLPEAELAVITAHLIQCQPCHDLFADALRKRRGSAPLKFELEPQSLFKHEHVEFDQLVDLTEGKLDAIDQEVLEIHLSGCDGCREDVRSFLAFRKAMEPELHVRYGPVARMPQQEVQRWSWLHAFPRKPAYAAAVILVGITIVLTVVVIRRRAASFEARQPHIQNNNVAVLPTPAPEERLARQNPSPPVPSNEKQTENGAAAVVIKDGPIVVTIDGAHAISGIDGASPSTRREITNALVTERIETPDIYNSLSSPEGTLRGTNNGQTFKLRSPARVVILTDRPSFQWERLRGASSYRVYVGDGKGREVAKSEELSPAHTAWTVSAPLKRGEIYSWGVAAMMNGKEIFSPGPSGPEMKFQILPTEKLRELGALKKIRSHLALGLFYAKTGMLAEAEQQFRILIRLNPDSRVLKKLVKQIQSWKRS